MKKILSILLCAASLSAAAYDCMVGGIAYNLNGNTAIVTYTKFGNNYPNVEQIAIPEKVFHAGHEYRVTAIGGYAFYECETLKKLSIPISVTEIGEYAAFGSELLSDVTIGSNVKTIGRYAFSETNIPSLSLPVGVEEVGDYAFAGCPRLATLDTGNGLRQMGRSAFYNCATLTEATLGVNITSIGTNAFGRCAALSQINANMPDPMVVEVGYNAFDGVNKMTCRLHVPRGSLEAYKEAPVWQEFQLISDAIQGYALGLEFSQIVNARGENSTLDVTLQNDDAVSALRCDIVLPTGMKIVKVNGEYDINLDETRRARDHSVSVNANEATNTYTVLVSSPTGKALKNNSGRVLTIRVETAAMEPGDYFIYARNASIAKPSSEYAYLPDVTLPIVITRTYLLGDANGDGTVDVADYVVTASRLIGKPVVAFFDDAADVNRNGDIDIGDLVGITQRALGKIQPEVIEIH